MIGCYAFKPRKTARMNGAVLEEDGVMARFLTALQVGFALVLASGSGSAFTGTALAKELVAGELLAGEPADEVAMSPDMVGAYFMRDSLVPRADDLALIQRKPALYLASFNDGMATVAYSLDEGRIVYRVVSGTVDDAAREAIDHALARLQRKLA
ncbi:hypothetical protein [Novosphingobium sp. ZW T3_23]|uniref:hypothetical protein n=1 Tax=Novosphingobium sp. ZW T3_23 TaxID=3378084 RepID=UPI00385252E8